MKNEKSEHKILAPFLIALFFGTLGIHRMIVGKVGTGIVMLLLTLSLFGMLITGVWALVDIIMLATGNFKDKEGKVIKDWQ